MLPAEPTILAGRRAFADAQVLLSGAGRSVGSYTVSWYGTEVSDERGSFALVHPRGALAGAVGNVLEVRYAGRRVTVYVIGSYAQLSTDLGLTRRAYLAISRLSKEPILCPVQVVQ